MVIYQTMCNLLFNSCPNKSVGVWFQKFVRTVFYFDFALEGIIHRLHKKPSDCFRLACVVNIHNSILMPK